MNSGGYPIMDWNHVNISEVHVNRSLCDYSQLSDFCGHVNGLTDGYNIGQRSLSIFLEGAAMLPFGRKCWFLSLISPSLDPAPNIFLEITLLSSFSAFPLSLYPQFHRPLSTSFILPPPFLLLIFQPPHQSSTHNWGDRSSSIPFSASPSSASDLIYFIAGKYSTALVTLTCLYLLPFLCPLSQPSSLSLFQIASLNKLSAYFSLYFSVYHWNDPLGCFCL